ncbi:tyrosine-protein kinase Srms [Microcaecilia unicolor]|uniref:Tyrosine-protein kinase n=1 Tax=Microcaecilia unicolor TaxID=1415580 RepID=A0A6P7YZD3_9AMPH|nr:tyrosine-protein kinase Srms [Microcaecilia unicolor]
MEVFARKHMSFLDCLWNRMWPHLEQHCEMSPNSGMSLSPHSAMTPSLTPSPTSDQNQNLSLKEVNVPSTSTVFIVLYDFRARSNEELTVRQGERLHIVRKEGDYVLAVKTCGSSDVGLVPTNYVVESSKEPFFNEPWYFDGINRTEAEKLLLSSLNQLGSYLIRPSETYTDQYSLSVRVQNRVTHICIKKTDGNFYIQKNRSFSSLQDLLTFYKMNWKLIKSPLLYPCVRQELLSTDAWEQPRSDFQPKRKLGEGYFGEVWEGLWKGTYPVAIKTMKQADVTKTEFQKEIQALKSLRHPNLIQLFAVCTIGEPIYIVTELMQKGNLLTYLNSADGRMLTPLHLMHITCQVAEGMVYLAEKHVVHRDLAARNILVGDNLMCKIADFGLARLLKEEFYSPSSNTKIPVKWTAPEAAIYQRYSLKSDVWSYGIVLYEIFTYGEQPYSGMTNREVLEQLNHGYRLPRPRTCPADVYQIMLSCWRDEEDLRPSFQNLRDKLNSINTNLNCMQK